MSEPEHWKPPEGGDHMVAIKSKTYAARAAEVDNFFGRMLSKSTHDYTYEGNSYAVFSFRDKADAEKFMRAFDGEEFDPRDVGGGSKWMFWFKGRVSKRKKKPYDFRP